MIEGGRDRALARYAKAMETVPPLTAVIMLYDGVLRLLAAAAAAAENGEHPALFNCAQRAGLILTGLDAALDHHRSPAAAATLHRCYRVFIHRILALPRRRDAAQEARHLAQLLREVRNAWAQIDGAGAASLTPAPGGFNCRV